MKNHLNYDTKTASRDHRLGTVSNRLTHTVVVGRVGGNLGLPISLRRDGVGRSWTNTYSYGGRRWRYLNIKLYTCGRMAMVAFETYTYYCGRMALAAFEVDLNYCGGTALAAFETIYITTTLVAGWRWRHLKLTSNHVP